MAAPKKQKSIDRAKFRAELFLSMVIIILVAGLTALEVNVVRLGPGIPVSNSILFFSLININAVLLIMLIFLVLRNFYRFFFAPSRQMLRAKIKTKLVVAFISLSLGPTILLFFTSLQFITTSHDFWFNTNVEQSLGDAVKIGQYYQEIFTRYSQDYGLLIRDQIQPELALASPDLARVRHLLESARTRLHISEIKLVNTSFAPLVSVRDQKIPADAIGPAPKNIMENALASRRMASIIDPGPSGDVVRTVLPLTGPHDQPLYLLSLSYYNPVDVSGKLETITKGLYGYQELEKFRDPFKIANYITLSIVTLLIIFAATWFGFRLADSITGPILDLAEGTSKVAAGNYDFAIEAFSTDEIGTLVDSFNRMTRDLKASKNELTRKNVELYEKNAELEQRRRYMETVLQNVAGGVVSTDAQGRVTTINTSAKEILGLSPGELIGKGFENMLAEEYREVLAKLHEDARRSPRGVSYRQARLYIGERALSLGLSMTLLTGETGQNLGMVIVFDDFTELEKAQRMAAWREVARRIAHEIKNPLTPIQLSAQRLKKRYQGRLKGDGGVFEECTEMIIRQVEELRRLVDEFSNFARMPAARPAPNDLAGIVKETLVLYREGHKGVVFSLDERNAPPVFNLDRQQIKRALINLIDNALTAVGGQGEIKITLDHDPDLKTARLEVADNGPGVRFTDRARLFDPYYTTKKDGTGLGLPIVSTIVQDHGGFVRVFNNHPRGARFIIELPIRT